MHEFENTQFSVSSLQIGAHAYMSETVLRQLKALEDQSKRLDMTEAPRKSRSINHVEDALWFEETQNVPSNLWGGD